MAYGWGKAQPRKDLPNLGRNPHITVFKNTNCWGGAWYEQGMEHILHHFDSPHYHVGLLPGTWAMATKMGADPSRQGAPLILHGYGGNKGNLDVLTEVTQFVAGVETLWGLLPLRALGALYHLW